MAKDKSAPKVKKERFKTIKQILEVIKMTNELNPKFKIFAPLAFAVPFLVLLIVGIVTTSYVAFIPLGVLAGLVGFMLVLSRMAQKAGYDRVDGQPGASGAVLNQLKLPSIQFDEQPIAVDPKTYDLIFRGTGRQGIYFVTEGPTNRVKKLVEKEVTRTKRILQNVPIHIINSGNESGQVPLAKLRSAIVKKKKVVLTKDELSQIRGRLNSLGGMRLPIPKGMDPNKTPKGNGRRALRGK
jgi:hypothetical protein